MRIPLITGVILIIAGLWILIRGVSYSREESVFKIGDIEAKVQQQHSVPEWIGGVALGAGVVLLIVSLRKR